MTFPNSTRIEVSVYYGDYESFGTKRLTVEAVLRPQSGSGLFVGVKSILGEGPDDVRLFGGAAFKWESLINLLENAPFGSET